MSRKLGQLRNIGIIAHIDAGKTTVTERMLYCAGFTHRVGGVDKGTTETDFDPEEQQRGITIYSACVTFGWNDVSVNLLDTPGHVDFTAEVERCLRVLDGGVVVFSAREGVEAQSETVWRQADKYHVPRMVFINKLDREGADFERTLKEIRVRLTDDESDSTRGPVAIQIPVGIGPPHLENAFRGVVDLVRMKMLTFTDEGATAVESEVPAELSDEAQIARHDMLDVLSNYSDELMELVLEDKDVPEKLIHAALRDATLGHHIQPVLCGSALDGIGVPPLLDAVAMYLPSPLDKPAVEGTWKSKKKKGEATVESRGPDPKEPFCGLAFKVIPAKTGDMTWVRIYSGELKSNSRVFNPGKDKKENVAQLWRMQASKKEQVDSVGTGDIVGIIGLRHSVTGDTLCDSQAPILLEPIEFPETVISMAIEPDSTADRKKLAEVLALMRRQDPTFEATENEDTGQTLISGMGELHLEVIKNRLLRDFNLKVKVHKPRVSYRETVGASVDVIGECHRQMGGQDLYAKVGLRMEPSSGAQNVMVTSRCSPDEIPPEMIAVVMDELRSRSEGGGVLGGFPLTQLKVTVTGGDANENSTEVAFRIAAGSAFEESLQSAGPVLLEPIMKLDISTPDEYVGEFVGDLQQRRAVIANTENRGRLTFIEARAPLSELFGYSSAVRSLSQGLAGWSMEPHEYAPAPPSVGESFGGF